MQADDLPEPLRELDSLIHGGQARKAVQRAEALLREKPDDPALSGRLGFALEAAGERARALEVLETANARLSGARLPVQRVAETKFYLAVTLVSARQFGRAAELAEEIIALGVRGASIFATAGKARLRLGDIGKAIRWNAEAIAMRDLVAAAAPSAATPVPHHRPRPFDPNAPARNLIAYSLFGTNAYYHECAVTTARMALVSFPDFTARFYCGLEVPSIVVNALRQTGAEVRVVDEQAPVWAGLFWRFRAFDDASADLGACSGRRLAAHTARARGGGRLALQLRCTVPRHEGPSAAHQSVMAGLWGGFTGLLPPLQPLIEAFLAKANYRYADQSFLNQQVWPRIRQASLTHDSNFDLPNTRRFPNMGRVSRGVHVGWSWPAQFKSGRSAL